MPAPERTGRQIDFVESSSAVLDERERNWTVTGQKVWTSFAQFARWGIVACRTDADVGKRDGISILVLDMHGEGVEVRPLRQMTGDSEFNEVFIDGATVPDEDRLGPIGAGLANSPRRSRRRAAVELGSWCSCSSHSIRAICDSLISRYAPLTNATLRDRLTQVYIDDRVLELTNRRMADERGRNPEIRLNRRRDRCFVTSTHEDAFTTSLSISVVREPWPGRRVTCGMTGHRGRSSGAAPPALVAGRRR